MPRPFLLVCDGAPPLAALERLFADVGTEPWRHDRLVRRLYDSADRRLRDAGLYLCRDVGDGTSELRLVDRDGRLRVGPLAAAAPGGKVDVLPTAGLDAPLAARLGALLAPRVLLAVRSWAVERSRRRCLNEDAKVIGELVLERHLYADAAVVTVTAMPLRGYRREFGHLLASARDGTGLAPAPGSAAALLDARLHGCWDRPPGPPRITRKTPAFAAVGARLGYFRAVMQANERGIRDDLDSEFLHDFRVALRRARALLQSFGDVLPDATALREGCAWLSRETSLLRDLDVWLAALDDGATSASPALQALLLARRRREHARLARLLGGRRYARFQAEWQAWLERLVTAPAPAAPLRALVDTALRRRHRRLCRRRRGHGDALPWEVLHEIRKDVKKLRYLLDAFASLYPRKRVRPLIESLKAVQALAGEVCDRWAHASLARAWRDAATDAAERALFDAALVGQDMPPTVDLAARAQRPLTRALDALCDADGLDRLRRLCDKER
ncbi:MAG: CHAD domain-containing protein [Gammaproteobacteria bacterium]